VSPSGFLNVLKPPGLTSHDVVDLVRRRLPKKTKVGHLGTLDPAAAGVLPLAIGAATKLIPLLPDLGSAMKSYLAHIQLGLTTSTDDLEGEVLTRVDPDTVPRVSKEMIDKHLDSFRGSFLQVPPQVSAVRQDGKRAYEKARQGETFQLAPRSVSVQELRLLDYQPETGRLQIHMLCGSGTYVRSLARDLGELLGTGGTLAFLLRTHSGPFHLVDSFSLEELMTETVAFRLLPVSFPFADLPRVDCLEKLEHKGQTIQGTFEKDGLLRARGGLLRRIEGSLVTAVVEALFDEVSWD
jgi:tRNA pseudouridine55 synthase